MKTKISVGDKYYLESAIEINAEMHVLLILALKELKKTIEDDDYFMLRAIKRLSIRQFEVLNELNNNLE